jgi:hypothetical protein
MSRKLSDYLRTDKKRVLLFQARIDGDLHAAVNKVRKRKGLRWRDIVEAGFKQYLDEVK